MLSSNIGMPFILQISKFQYKFTKLNLLKNHTKACQSMVLGVAGLIKSMSGHGFKDLEYAKILASQGI